MKTRIKSALLQICKPLFLKPVAWFSRSSFSQKIGLLILFLGIAVILSNISVSRVYLRSNLQLGAVEFTAAQSAEIIFQAKETEITYCQTNGSLDILSLENLPGLTLAIQSGDQARLSMDHNILSYANRFAGDADNAALSNCEKTRPLKLIFDNRPAKIIQIPSGANIVFTELNEIKFNGLSIHGALRMEKSYLNHAGAPPTRVSALTSGQYLYPDYGPEVHQLFPGDQINLYFEDAYLQITGHDEGHISWRASGNATQFSSSNPLRQQSLLPSLLGWLQNKPFFTAGLLIAASLFQIFGRVFSDLDASDL